MTEFENIQCQLFIDGYSLDFCFGNIDRFILRLFPISNLSDITIKTNQLLQLGHSNTSDNETTEVKTLELTVGQVIDRLETLGYSIERSRENFERAKAKTLSTQFSDIHGDEDFQYPSFPDQAAFETPRKSREYFSSLDFETLTKASQVVIQQKRRRIIEVVDGKRKSIIPKDISNPIERYLVCNGLGAVMFDDNISYIRLLLNDLNPDSKVQYLFNGFPIEDMPDIAKFYSYHFDPKELSSKYGLRSLIITEGVTDSKYLNFTLTKNFPHLIDLFYFLDFTIKDGNADAVVKVTLSLASSGVPNNIVALFDNDFEGNRAKQDLLSRLSPLPSNVYVLSYPNIDIAMNYPILRGGNSIEYADVNGRGCAIEMYLGEDFLTDGNELIPLTESQNGQLSFRKKYKTKIQKKFQEKIDNDINESNLLGLNKMAELVNRSYELYLLENKKIKDARQGDLQSFSNLYKEIKDFDKLDDEYYELNDQTMKVIEDYIRDNSNEICLDEEGEEFDLNFSGELKTYHSNKSVKEIIPLNKGVVSGAFKSYYENGQIQFEIQYRNGELTGTRIEYYENGNKKFSITKSESSKGNLYSHYYENGNLRSTEIYISKYAYPQVSPIDRK